MERTSFRLTVAYAALAGRRFRAWIPAFSCLTAEGADRSAAQLAVAAALRSYVEDLYYLCRHLETEVQVLPSSSEPEEVELVITDDALHVLLCATLGGEPAPIEHRS